MAKNTTPQPSAGSIPDPNASPYPDFVSRKVKIPSSPHPDAYQIEVPFPKTTNGQLDYFFEHFNDFLAPESNLYVDEHTFVVPAKSQPEAKNRNGLFDASTYTLDDLALLYIRANHVPLPPEQRAILFRHVGINDYERVPIAIADEMATGDTVILYAQAFEHFDISEDPKISDVSLLSVDLKDVKEFFDLTGNTNRLHIAAYNIFLAAQEGRAAQT